MLIKILYIKNRDMLSFGKLNKLLRKLWKRFLLRDIHYKNNYKGLDKLYLIEDPWQLNSPAEQFRFSETNRIIHKNFGLVNSILEVGCGEGHQSVYLKKICNQLFCLDISSRAIKRAKTKCPDARYFIGDIFSKEVEIYAPYDLVLACEVLYYVKEIDLFLKRLECLGKNCLVSYYQREIPILDPYIKRIKNAKLEEISYHNTRWRVAFWSH